LVSTTVVLIDGQEVSSVQCHHHVDEDTELLQSVSSNQFLEAKKEAAKKAAAEKEAQIKFHEIKTILSGKEAGAWIRMGANGKVSRGAVSVRQPAGPRAQAEPEGASDNAVANSVAGEEAVLEDEKGLLGKVYKGIDVAENQALAAGERAVAVAEGKANGAVDAAAEKGEALAKNAVKKGASWAKGLANKVGVGKYLNKHIDKLSGVASRGISKIKNKMRSFAKQKIKQLASIGRKKLKAGIGKAKRWARKHAGRAKRWARKKFGHWKKKATGWLKKFR